MATFEFTRRKLKRERGARLRRVAIVAGATAAALVVGQAIPGSESFSGLVRTAALGWIAAIASLLLTQ
jgi:hypothetical protein